MLAKKGEAWLRTATSSQMLPSPSSAVSREVLSPARQTQTLWGQRSWTWPCGSPGGCSLGLGYNLGFMQQEAPSQAALCLISCLCERGTAQRQHQHSILLTPPVSLRSILTWCLPFKHILTSLIGSQNSYSFYPCVIYTNIHFSKMVNCKLHQKVNLKLRFYSYPQNILFILIK